MYVILSNHGREETPFAAEALGNHTSSSPSGVEGFVVGLQVDC